MADFVRLASLSDVPQGEMLIVQFNGDELVLANVDGEIYAFGNECTHRGGPLGEGVLEGVEVECPFHQGRFNVKTGEVVDAPPTDPVPSFQVQVEGDDIKNANGESSFGPDRRAPRQKRGASLSLPGGGLGVRPADPAEVGV